MPRSAKGRKPPTKKTPSRRPQRRGPPIRSATVQAIRPAIRG